MSGEERLPEDRWRRVGVSGSLRRRRSEEMTQSNTFFPQSRKYLLSPRRLMAIEVSHNEKVFGGGKDGEGKGIGSAILGEEQIGGA